MKIITDYAYKPNHKKVLVGYWFEAEDETEEVLLSVIRNQIFFGLKDLGTLPEYAGRIDDKSTNLVKAIGYEIPANVKSVLNKEGIIRDCSKYTKEHILNK